MRIKYNVKIFKSTGINLISFNNKSENHLYYKNISAFETSKFVLGTIFAPIKTWKLYYSLYKNY